MNKEKRKTSGYWDDKKKCSEAAVLCSSRSEFIKKYPTAYSSSLKNGWIDEICEHMKGRPIPCGYWNKERCRLEALKYTNRSEFSKQSNGAYRAALKKGWLDEICKHMIVKWHPKWDKESCRLEALKYTNRSVFSKQSNGAWTAALKKGWLDEICKHMIVKWQPKWDKESCWKEALKYITRTDFQSNAVGAWTAASKKGWLDEICSHMEVLGNLFQRCIYAFEFPDDYVYVGLTDNFRRREKQHLSSPISPVYQHIQESKLNFVAKILHEYTDRVTAQKLEKSFLEDYINKGWIALNKAKTGSLGGKNLYWTKERCVKAGRKCRTKTELLKRYSGAYASAVKNGWYNEVTAHMISPIASPQNWNLEKLQAEALKYNTKKDFFRKSISAYNYARKNKLLNQICSHMIHPTPTKIWTFGALQTEALKYKSRSEFGNCNSAAYTIASKTHILDKICNHMESQIKCHNYWAKEKCRERALLYTAKSDFKKYDGSAYTTAVREKWLNEICTHMTKPPVKRKWTFETLYTEAQKYKTIKEFKEKSHSAYVTAVSLGFVKQICFHMYTGKRKAKLIMEREQALKDSSTNNPQPPQK